MTPQTLPSGDWEEKTVVDDSQLYSTKEGPGGLSIGTTTGDEELTIDEPQRALSAMSRASVASQRPAPAPPVVEAIQAKLVVLAGSDSGREFALRGSSITVGRGIDNDVVLTDISVSRRHLSIAFDGSRYHLTDKGSGNGTLINQRVETATCKLRHGDRIEIGNTVFRFEHPASKDDPWTGSSAPAGPAPEAGIPTRAGPPAPPPRPPGTSRPQPGPRAEPPALPEPGPASPPDAGLAAPVAQEPTSGPPAGAPWESASPTEQAPAAALAGTPATGPASAAFGSGASLAARPLVPSRPLDRAKTIIAVTATAIGLVAMSVVGIIFSDDEAAAALPVEQVIHVEDLLEPVGIWAITLLMEPSAPALPQEVEGDAGGEQASDGEAAGGEQASDGEAAGGEQASDGEAAGGEQAGDGEAAGGEQAGSE